MAAAEAADMNDRDPHKNVLITGATENGLERLWLLLLAERRLLVFLRQDVPGKTRATGLRGAAKRKCRWESVALGCLQRDSVKARRRARFARAGAMDVLVNTRRRQLHRRSRRSQHGGCAVAQQFERRISLACARPPRDFCRQMRERAAAAF